MSNQSSFNEVVTSHQPKSLFKFYNWAKPEEAVAFGRKVLSDNQLWFSRPRSFNDPFDAFVTQGELFGEGTENADLENTSRQHSCCCFSLRWDSTLMWSHYARSHRGYCVEFDVSGLLDLFRETGEQSDQQDVIELRRVQYGTVPANPISPEDLAPDSLTDLARDFFSTKSRDWAYEEEVRAIRLQTLGAKTGNELGTPLMFNPQKCIRAVLLGRRISDEHKNDIRECIEPISASVGIEQCRRVKGAFLLRRVDLDG